MKDIRLTYFDTDICLPTYILTFFRIIGIYVYEKIIYHDQRKILGEYPEFPFDIEIVIIGNSNLKSVIAQNAIAQNAIILNSCINEVNNNNEYVNIINVDLHDTPKDSMKKLLICLCDMYDQFNMEKESLFNLLDLYDENEIMETILGTRFFAPDKKIYFYDNYCKAVAEIRRKVYNFSTSIFVKFTFVYLAYEYNYYCKRLKKVFLFDVNSMLNILDELAQKSKGQWSDLELLYAQIYDDLLEKYREASVFYAKAAEKGYNAFACYKMGNIWMREYKDIVTALRYFTKAVEISPCYYRAIYKMAECYYSLQNNEKAKLQYIRIVKILQERSIKQILRPMEVEYLYKAYKNLAKIDRNCFNNISGAISYYEKAENLWNRIYDSSESFNSGFKKAIQKHNSEKIDLQYYLLKEKLKIEQIYNNLETLNSQILKNEKAIKYEKLLMKEGE